MIWICIPVFAIRENLYKLVETLLYQALLYRVKIKIIVVNHGVVESKISSYFPQRTVMEIRSNGKNIWWTGAINIGLRYVLHRANDEDYFGMLNDDDQINSEYLINIWSSIKKFPHHVIGSHTITIDELKKTSIKKVCCGVYFDENTLRFQAKTHRLQDECILDEIRTLSGKGTFLPVKLCRKFPKLKQNILPHYGADFAYFSKIRRSGVPLAISSGSLIIKMNLPGWQIKNASSLVSAFGRKSVNNIFMQLYLIILCVRLRDIPRIILRRLKIII